ncbi:hypothetical protein Hamer_G021395 [Homarus americanus]|uniref:Uncharacterized protein n=1 Tax=Homarus americanus TaxID=6706 RepID=A0A8J5MNH0_HOMAM|nr:hypothetical protein Hamer_G021395 [Homarus americanus]
MVIEKEAVAKRKLSKKPKAKKRKDESSTTCEEEQSEDKADLDNSDDTNDNVPLPEDKEDFEEVQQRPQVDEYYLVDFDKFFYIRHFLECSPTTEQFKFKFLLLATKPRGRNSSVRAYICLFCIPKTGRFKGVQAAG